MIVYSDVPEGFNCVKERGPHLQLQFIIPQDGGYGYSKRAYIFRSNEIEGLEVFPVNESSIEIPKNSISMFIFGLQYRYSSRKEAESSDGGFTEEYDPHPGEAVKIGNSEEPVFTSFEIKLDNTIWEGPNNKNTYMYQRVNFTDDKKGIRSISLTEPLEKINDYTYHFASALASTIKESKESKESKEAENRAITMHMKLLMKAELWKRLN